MLSQNYPLHNLVSIQWPFNFTTGSMHKSLEESIQHIGVLNPIQICIDSPSILITGKRRLLLARRLKHKTIPVRIIENLSELEAFRIGFYENLESRELNVIEKSHILFLLTHHFQKPISELYKKYCPLLSIPPKEKFIHDYIKIYHSTKILKSALMDGVISFESATRLILFPDEDHQCIIDTIRELKLGLNAQKELLELCWEIWKKCTYRVNNLLQQASIKEIFSEKAWSEKQRWSKLQHQLKMIRFPMLMSLEEEFDQVIKTLSLPPSIAIRRPIYFEANDYKISFSFKNKNELEERILNLKQILQSKDIDKLFTLTGNQKNKDT